jgi:hypothetical protein
MGRGGASGPGRHRLTGSKAFDLPARDEDAPVRRRSVTRTLGAQGFDHRTVGGKANGRGVPPSACLRVARAPGPRRVGGGTGWRRRRTPRRSRRYRGRQAGVRGSDPPSRRGIADQGHGGGPSTEARAYFHTWQVLTKRSFDLPRKSERGGGPGFRMRCVAPLIADRRRKGATFPVRRRSIFRRETDFFRPDSGRNRAAYPHWAGNSGRRRNATTKFP